jgi:uncharacterized protein YndB with AHSA1/START domain
MSDRDDHRPLDISFPSETEVRVQRMFEAPRSLVWTVWTTPAHMEKWMLGPPGWTMRVLEHDFRPGGTWRYAWQRENGTEMVLTGVFKSIAPPESFSATERWGDPWPETLNTNTFREDGPRTQVVLDIAYPSKEARDAALKTGMNDGMAATYARLDDLLATLV